MCGIVGYVGWRNATEVLLEGLQNLEYRGYDSSGIAVHLNTGNFFHARAEGKLANLLPKIQHRRPLGFTGIGHTRWATHGKPSERNAHPHAKEGVYVVHNGIIENYAALKEELISRDIAFHSETDTEVFAALLQEAVGEGLSCQHALERTLAQIKGSYAFVVLFNQEPEHLWVARSGSPLIIGIGKEENLVASDIPALLPYTKQMLMLDDGEYAALTHHTLEVWNAAGEIVSPDAVQSRIKTIPWTVSMAQKGGYKHFMLKEIFEQPEALDQTLLGKVDSDSRHLYLEEMEECLRIPFRDVAILACGTSYHAGMVGKYYIERLSKVPASIEYASEFRYRTPLMHQESLYLGISQSGETIDTLYALKSAKEAGAVTATICNVLDASIPRMVDYTLYTRAGPEIGVASTKAFTTQLELLLLMAVKLGSNCGHLDADAAIAILDAVRHLPALIETSLAKYPEIRQLSEHYLQSPDFFYMSRGPLYPIALEGALKLKEISYIHAEGYAAGELKHGTIALIEDNTPVIAILSQEDVYREKMISNIEEIQARGAHVIVIAPETLTHLPRNAAHVITYPGVPWYLEPFLSVIPLQLLAYSIADLKGTDVDQPRNLAKSVTVE